MTYIELIQNAHRFFVVCIFVLVKFLNTIKISVIIFYNFYKILLRTFVKNTHTYIKCLPHKNISQQILPLFFSFFQHII